jgi:hypothetical protein
VIEEKSWRVWQNDNKNFVAYSNLCMCVVFLGCILGVIYYFSRRLLAEDEVPGKAEGDIEAAKPENKPILEPQTPSDKPSDKASDKPIQVDEVVPQTEADVPQTEAEGKDAEGKEADDTEKDAAGAAAAEKDAVLEAAAQMESGRGDEGKQFEDPPRDITGIALAFEESQVLEPPVVGTAVRIAEFTPEPQTENCSAACLACCNASNSANASDKQVAAMIKGAAGAA